MPGSACGVDLAVPGAGWPWRWPRVRSPTASTPRRSGTEKRERCSDLRRERGCPTPAYRTRRPPPQQVGCEVGGEPPHPARRVIAERGRLGQPDQWSEHDRLNEAVLERGRVSPPCARMSTAPGAIASNHTTSAGTGGDHPLAPQAGHPGDQDPPLPAAQHEPVEPRPDDRDQHDSNRPMIAGQLSSCSTRATRARHHRRRSPHRPRR